MKMSFGFGIGDFLAAFTLAVKVRDRWTDAPKEYKSIKEESKNVENILRDIGQLGTRIDLDQQQENNLKQACRSCREVLEDCEKLVDKYSAVQKATSGRCKVRRAWTRLKVDPDDIRHLRNQLSAQITQLGLLHDVIETDLVIDVHEGVEDLLLDKLQRERMAATDWYSPADFANQQTDQLSQRENGTGGWFLAHDKYKHWKQHGNDVLLCPGIPGSGKSVMVATIIDNLQACFETNTDIAVIYFYCNFNRQAEQNLNSMLAILVRQLFQEQVRLPDPVMKLYLKHRDRATQPSIEELKTVLRFLVTLYKQVFVVIDALDECGNVDHQRDNLLDELFSLQKSGGSNINILATTRSIPDIIQRFVGHPQIEIRAHEGDIEAYLTARMSSLSKFVLRDVQLQEGIKSRIVTAAQGMFLLAKLQFDSLRDKTNRGHMMDALTQLGEGSDALHSEYDKTIDRIDQQLPGWRNLARCTLLWVIYAKRQLSIDELREAIAIDPQRPHLNLHDYLDDEDQIVSVCHSLVEVDRESRVVRLVHYTTQEYFEKICDQWLPDGHIKIAKSCIAYLSMDMFLHSRCAWEMDLSTKIERHKFLLYAGQYWGLHARGISDQELISDTTNFLSNPDYVRLSAMVAFGRPYIFNTLYKCNKSDISAMHLCCHFNLFHVLQNLIQQGKTIANKDENPYTALHYAASKGYRQIIQLLLAQPGIDANRGHISTGTLSGGYIQGVQRLNQRPGIEVNSGSLNGHTLSTCATRRFLNVEAKSKYTCSSPPLAEAAREGHTEIVRLLLSHPGVDVNYKNTYGNTPLAIAALCGRIEAVKVLLAHPDIDVNSKNKNGDTPQSLATARNHMKIVRLLLSHASIEINSKDPRGYTPLNTAAAVGNTGIVQILLSHPGIEVNSKDAHGYTPLADAVFAGHIEMVQLLLSHSGIEVNSKDMFGLTPLAVATRKGHIKIVRLLLSHHSIDINSKDLEGYSPLAEAAILGNKKMVRLLLSHPGIEVSSKNEKGYTPYSLASERGYKEIAKLLLNGQ